MTTPATTPSRFIGCDAGKARIDIFDDRAGASAVPNSFDALLAWARTLGPDCFVVCEATGGYEAALLEALLCAGVAVHRADARKVKAFIRSFGTLGKTDALDARALARYAREREASLQRWSPPDESRVALKTMVMTRRDLVAARTAFANRDKAPGAEPVRPHLCALLECLDAQIAALDADIARLIDRAVPLSRAVKVLRAIPGVGPVTAAALLALLPELGTCDRRKIAALAGLAPHPRQSGAANAYRSVKGGRPEVKRVLFMAAMAAAKCNGQIKAAYQNLRNNGKKPLVALTAIMRKIVVIANARIRDDYAALS